MARLVSTHALAKSATGDHRRSSGGPRGFNPRTREECDAMATSMPTTISRFQPTHSRRVRRPTLPTSAMSTCFNPRTREECDAAIFGYRRLEQVSTHALAKSATEAAGGGRWLGGFQPTHSRRVRPRHAHSLERQVAFQPTHSRRVRLAWRRMLLRESGRFNPRTREECDDHAGRLRDTAIVSTHALAKSATSCRRHPPAHRRVSTHALAKSATGGHARRITTARVSTHALAKSATIDVYGEDN